MNRSRKKTAYLSENALKALCTTLAKNLCVALSACLMLALCGCGGGNSTASLGGPQVAGNWQFAMQNPPGNSFTGGLQGGFLQQQNGSFAGQVAFSITPIGSTFPCNSGTATVSGTLNGHSVTMTALIGTLAADGTPATQTLTLSGGVLSSDNSVIQNGTYTLTAGFANVNGQIVPCGTAQDTGNWSATSVPPLNGLFQGFFHSTSGGNGFQNEDFPLSGSFTQGANIGASSATITGQIAFQDPQTKLNDYPCLTSALVNGQISGNSVVLQIFDLNGSDVGQIGDINASGLVTFDNTQGGYVLHNLGGKGSGYAIANTKGCPGVSLQVPGDGGNLCFAFGNSTGCTQPVTLSPISFTFPPQLLGSTPTTQTFTLTNTDPSGSTLTGLSLNYAGKDSDLFYLQGGGDFNGLPNFTEQDDCGTPPFSLAPQQSCTITIAFSPQESCPWLPFQSSGNPPIQGLPPAKCPGIFNPNIPINSALLTGGITVNSPSSVDGDKSFYLPVQGTGLSAIVPSTREVDFGAQDLGESSVPQTVSFINQGATSVQILPATDISSVCNLSLKAPFVLPYPPTDGTVPGLVVVASGGTFAIAADSSPPPPSLPTVAYYCDNSGPGGLSSFQITSDMCSGMTLAPQQSCNVQITYAPQPDYVGLLNTQTGLDYFLELNTVGEIDSGRFPLELKANAPGPLRMTPGAGLDFGVFPKGSSSSALTITLTNDPKDNLTVSFTGKSMQRADYTETDDCPFTLASGASCTLSFVFTPSITGFDIGQFTLSYNTVENHQFGLTHFVYLRGYGQ